MTLIFVESPSKAKAINEYLKDSKENFIAIATMGHIRNLSRKSGSINVNQDFEYTWEFTPQWEKNKQKILKEVKQADQIIIASDPDREGEAIAWHLKEVLRANKIKCNIERMIFHSISKQSILEALNNKTELRTGLVNSYLARVGLDYLFGYSVSPLLWRKVPCCKSAGRVQSASLKLIVDKENEIQNFKKKKYITIHSYFEEIDDALLTQMNDEKFENGNIFNLNLINLDDIRKNIFKIIAIDKTKQKQNPPSPLITSKLQQLASSQLNFSPTVTMQLAQKLYEGFSVNGKHTGLITYMRTDSFHIEAPAVDFIRKKIESKYGKEYLSNKVFNYKKSVKNAQEAHEAIRPIDINLEPDMITFPDENLKKLYNLIWTRTLATQFSPAILEKTNIKIENKDTKNNYLFEINDTFIAFDSFKKIIQNENNDDKEAKKIDLSKITVGQELNCVNVYAKDHETQPPKRYSESTFISQLEKLGIGRPSTYAKISSVLFEREYIEKQKKAILPTQKGWLVTAFLDKFFEKEVQHEFTSKMEEKLDDISNKNEKHKPMIEDFWNHIKKLIDNAQNTSPLEVAKFIETKYPTYFKSNESKCECGADLVLKITKFGAMRGCVNYPNCKKIESIVEYEKVESNIIGHTDNNEAITFKNGPYGHYLEIQQDIPKRISIPKNLIKDDTMDPILAVELTKLPKIIGEYNNKEIKMNIGKFGLYLEYDKKFVSIPSPIISYENAIEKIEAKTNTRKKVIKKS